MWPPDREPLAYDPPADAGEVASRGRPYLGIWFECCGVYARVYRRPTQDFYAGRCPKCLRALRVRVGPDGTDARFFHAW